MLIARDPLVQSAVSAFAVSLPLEVGTLVSDPGKFHKQRIIEGKDRV